MNRTLHASRRPLIALGVFYAPLSVLGLYAYVQSNFRPDRLAVAVLFPILYAATMAIIYSTRVRVSDTGITITTWYVMNRFIPFSEISHSSVQILAERDWPVSMSIFGENRHIPLGRISLKAIRKEDAAWLCSLPQVRPVIHPGLTKRA